MKSTQHPDLASGRWWNLSLFEQSGNVGTEISRAIRWTSRNPDLAPGAFAERSNHWIWAPIASPLTSSQ
jgi:hypothetical protein